MLKNLPWLFWHVTEIEDTDPRWLGTRSLYLVHYPLWSWENCGVRTGEESQGQQNLDASLVWSLPRSFSWTSALYSLFLSFFSVSRTQIRCFIWYQSNSLMLRWHRFTFKVGSCPSFCLKACECRLTFLQGLLWWKLVSALPHLSPPYHPLIHTGSSWKPGMSQPPGLCTYCSLD